MSNIVIYGMAKTGKCLQKLLLSQNHNVWMYDDNVSLCPRGISGIPIEQIDKIVLSPGVLPDAPLLQVARNRHIDIVCELQYCFDIMQASAISVTGTNGKTTVTQMIYKILSQSNKRAYLLGNGGVPLSSCVNQLTSDDIAVLESSSFQLMYCTNFTPNVSLITNLACDHINYHGTYDNYIQAKLNNCKFQHANQYAIFNADDKECCKLSQHTNAHKLYYSLADKNANCYCDGDNLVINTDTYQSIVKSNLQNKLSKVNLSNALGAILVATLYGVSLQQCVDILADFKADAHRMATVTMLNGVQFIDDSKATNVHATVNALSCMDNKTVVILGGSDKGEQYDQLFDNAPYGMVALGATAQDILACANKHKYTNIRVVQNMQQAVETAYDMLQGKGYVLLSPACASFDSYRSYSERGEHFEKVVKQFAKNINRQK